MKLFTFCLSLIIACQGLAQQTDRQLIEQTLNNYIEGTSYSYPDRIRAAFYEDANLFLSKEDQELYIVKINDYASFFDKNTPGTFTGRVGNIISIDQYQNIATAKLEIIVPKGELRFIDLLLLKKLNDQWKIISKTATSEPSDDHGNRILFILSSADHHGSSTISAGNSFSEIVNAHQQFKKAGYIVDFVSPEGGAAPLVYINTSVKSHLTYLYDQDFMESLKNTMQPTDVDPADYRAVYYVGGSGAMYGVPENEAIQRMVMEIYEKHDGIISSVCHGTAGIVNLKTSDGQYLVKN
ncbi:MAG: nuclear transport factor 2 family protein, partial [Bacteroidota bacterium]